MCVLLALFILSCIHFVSPLMVSSWDGGLLTLISKQQSEFFTSTYNFCEMTWKVNSRLFPIRRYSNEASENDVMLECIFFLQTVRCYQVKNEIERPCLDSCKTSILFKTCFLLLKSTLSHVSDEEDVWFLV